MVTGFTEGENLVPLDFDLSREFLAFSSGNDLGTWLPAFGQVLSITREAPTRTRFFGWIDTLTAE